MAVGFNTFFRKTTEIHFIVKNITKDKKRIKIFNYPIEAGESRDLLSIDIVSESDIRHSLIKGELAIKIKNGDIAIVGSNIDLLQFSDSQKKFLEDAGLNSGAEMPSSVVAYNDTTLPSFNETTVQGAIDYIKTHMVGAGSTPNKLRVGKAGDIDYMSIAEAVSYAINQGANITSPWEITIDPGTYIEPKITIQDGIALSNDHASNMGVVFVQAENPNDDLFICNGGHLAGITVKGVTHPDHYCIKCSSPYKATFLHGISIGQCYNGILVSNSAQTSILELSVCLNDANQDINKVVTITGENTFACIIDSKIFVSSLLLPAYSSNPIQIGISVDDKARTFISSCVFNIDNLDNNSQAVHANNASKVIVTASQFSYCGSAVHIGSIEGNTTINIQACSFYNNYFNIYNESTTGAIFVNGTSADTFRYHGDPKATYTGMIQYEDENKVKLIGNLGYKFNTGSELDLSIFFADNSSTGVTLHGEITKKSGLHIDVAAGTGWIQRNSPYDDTYHVSWDLVTDLDLIPSSTNYIVYNPATSSIITQTTPASNIQIKLSEVITDADSVRFIHKLRTPLYAFKETLQSYLLNTRKLALNSGLVPEIGSSNKKITLSSGSYYLGIDNMIYSGSGPDGYFSYFHGINGSVEAVYVNEINDTQYNLSGTLTTMADGYYKNDLIVITSDERLSIIYGDAQFETLLLARNGVSPSIPTFINGSAFPIAKIIIKKGAGISELFDVRSQPGEALGSGGTGYSAITSHSLLSDLDKDTHLQYLLNTGARAMSGDLNMASNNIINVALIDGVDIPSHASRHNPGGIDAMTLGTPVALLVGVAATEGDAASYARSNHQHGVAAGINPSSIGTSNTEGSSPSVARADHVHNHGDQTIGTLHAEVIVNSTSGFMTGADKARLDGMDDNSTNTPLSIIAPVNVTKAAAAAGSSTAAAKSDHKHDISTAIASAIAIGDSATEGSATSLARSDHKHALTAGTPVSIGTANSDGAANTFAKSDHIHAHGNQTVGTLHADVVVNGTSGFMTGTDKARLDGMDNGATNTPLTSTAPVNITKAAAAIGSSTAAAKSDHKHDISTATASAIAIGDAATEGSATSLARSDHKHTVTAGTPVSIGNSNSDGTASTFAKSDHLHNLPFSTVASTLGTSAGVNANYVFKSDGLGSGSMQNNTQIIARSLSVGISGDVQYFSIAAAISAAINGGASFSEPWEIVVHPGTYTEPAMIIPEGIIVTADHVVHFDAAMIIPEDPDNDLFTITGGYLSGLRLSGVTGVNKCLIRIDGPSTIFEIHSVSIYNCSNGIIISGGAHCIINNITCDITTPGQNIKSIISATGVGTYLSIKGATFQVLPNPLYSVNPIDNCISALNGSDVYIMNASCKVADKDGSSTVFYADGGSELTCMSSEISDSSIAFQIGAGGSNTKITTLAISFENNILNYEVNSSSGVVGTMHTTDSRRFSGVAGAKQIGVIYYRDEDLIRLLGNVKYQYLTTGKDVSFSEFFHNINSTGLSNGGIVTATVPTGLNIDISAGYGWITRVLESDAFYVSWGNATLPLTNAQTNYVIYDSVDELLKVILIPPSDLNILLATIITAGGEIRFLHSTTTKVDNAAQRLHNYLIETRKLTSKSGLSLTQGTTNRNIKVDAGSYYVGLSAINVDGYSTSNAPFSYFYGAGGIHEVSNQTLLDITNYDLLGTLTAMPGNHYRADTVCITSDNRISVIYGNAQFNRQDLAEQSAIMPMPTFIEPTGFPIAKVVIKEGDGIVSIIDTRYINTEIGAGASAITLHAALSGLSADDHTQYLLATGARAMSGGLNMGGNIITNVGNVGGVNISAHAARHSPGSTDALTTAVPVAVTVGSIAEEGSASGFARSDHQHGVSAGSPVAIGTVNSDGLSSSVARANHIHAHGDQTVGTLHAAVIDGGANGFMTGADKTKLDGIAAGATNTTLASTAPADVTKATAAIGSSATAAKSDHKHDISTAVASAIAIGDSATEGSATSLARSDHKHALTAGTPVSIDTANSDGTANTFAKSDHIHAHGNQTVGTLHADVIVGGTSGFMSGADKTKLNGIATNATNTPLAATTPEDVTKATATVGASTTAAKSDHKHDISTATASSLSVGGANAEGSATSLARSDHTHSLPAFGTTTGTFCQGNDSRLSDDRTASGLRTATTVVSISGATAPTAGQTLVATSSTNAAWSDSGAIKTCLFWGNSDVGTNTTVKYLTPAYEQITAPSTAIRFRIPFAGILKNMYVRHNVAGTGPNSIVYRVRVNGVNSALTTSLIATANDGNDLTHTVAVAQGDLLDLIVTKAANIASSPTEIVVTVCVI